MKKSIVLILLLSSNIPLLKANNEPEPPPVDQREIIMMCGIEAPLGETSCEWSFPAKKFAWIKTTTTCYYDIIVELTCHNPIEDGHRKTHLAVAKPLSYYYAIRGRWGLPYVWVDEYINPNMKFKYWTFSASFTRHPSGSECVYFLSCSGNPTGGGVWVSQ